MLGIEILARQVQNKRLVFVLNMGVEDDKAFRTWDSIKKGVPKSPARILEQKVNLYDAIRGRLAESGVECKPQGEISLNYLFRLEKPEDIAVLKDFLQQYGMYQKLEQRIHSTEEDKSIEDYYEGLRKYASK